VKTASWIISIALTIVVLSFSAQSGSESGDLSSSFVTTFFAWIEQTFPRWEMDIEVLHAVVRKGAHVASYFTLGFSWMITFLLGRYRMVAFGLFGLLLALLGEGIQVFAVDRGPSWTDSLLFNLPGYLMGGVIGFLFLQRIIHKKNNVS
jgi:VanZ family protein